jgi:VWFA-related protein
MLRILNIWMLWALAISAQTDFRVETRIVQVPVSVADRQGRSIEGLTRKDFTVLDNGAVREITLDTFGAGAAPISLVLAIQTSGISSPALAKIRRIGGMIQPLVIGRRGEAAVLTFDSEVKWRQDFTSDPEAIQLAIQRLKPGAAMQARMFDAIAEAAAGMRQRSGRRVMLLISESRDRGSETKFEQAIEAVERDGVEVFGAHYSTYSTAWIAKPEDLPAPSETNFLAVFSELARLGKTNDILALTQATGGADYPFLKERGIEKAIEKLGVEVHSQYILSFPERKDAAGMHRIDVTATNHPDVRIRSRRAYWSEPAGAGR